MSLLRNILLSCSAALVLTACDELEDFFGGPEPLTTGLHTMESDGEERSYYVLLPEDDSTTDDEELKPLIIGYHGSFASHQSWIAEGNSYGFVDEVGNDAIMVFPDALLLNNDQINWNFDYDFLFFEDLLAELDRRGLKYDRNRLFVLGHSSGAGMANEIGCRYGDIVRAIGVSSGALISGGSCIGSVAVIQTQGEVDQAVPINVGAGANRFWTLYNAHDPATSQPDVVMAPCVDYSELAFGEEPYPVQWCQHAGGHRWADFNAEAYWKFFSGLPPASPNADAPPGGGNEAALGDADTTINFTLKYPDDIAPVIGGAITLYPEDYDDGQFRAPDVFLNLNWDPNSEGSVTPGSEVTYSLVPVTFFVFGGEFDVSKPYKLQFSVYVEGGSSPIPTPNLDQKVILPIEFVDITTPIVIQETLQVAPVVPWF